MKGNQCANIYFLRKVVCLSLRDLPNHDAPNSDLGTIRKRLMCMSAPRWICDV